ncbi:MAG: 4-hydroxythreonine-4-phosphate dehydrogenase PdxA [Bacteroidaceae bacterium]|nr:4-hydroxythreonine-4-phosphate dehydrogenase PdxA [Bacteroidaceae bacterium]
MERIKIGITQGDINGIGYELILNTFETEEMASLCTPVIYGSPKVATYHRKSLGLQTSFQVVDSADRAKEGHLNMVNCFGEDESKIELGQATDEAGQAALISLDAALADLQEGKIDALVTSPINNATIQLAEGKTFKGQTTYIEEVTGQERKALKIFISGNLRIALATDKMPVSEIPAHITKDSLAERLVILHNTLKRDFFIDNPRIAVLALNPHADDKEEQEIIKPVIDELFKRGVRCVGPYPADEFFGTENHKHFDAVLAMYYDQGISAFKSIAHDEGINYTAGLPILRTAPAIGVGYDIAGKSMLEDVQPLRQAIYTAIDVARNRMRFDKERSNPLQKQYVAKHDDSDKLKLDQVEEEEN